MTSNRSTPTRHVTLAVAAGLAILGAGAFPAAQATQEAGAGIGAVIPPQQTPPPRTTSPSTPSRASAPAKATKPASGARNN